MFAYDSPGRPYFSDDYGFSWKEVYSPAGGSDKF